MKEELHLFIIWNNARNMEKEILEDISSNLTILKTIEIHWSKSNFVKNLMRFYGTKLHRWSFKDRECGNAPFLLVLVQDNSPIYEGRKTSRGKIEIVNTKMFDKKIKYRNWLGGNNSKVHCTNNIRETEHDLMLLLGMTIDEFMVSYKEIPDVLKQDIIGTKGWDDLEQVFKMLNATTEYVVLRNYEYLPKQFTSSEHGDIDILVNNKKEVMYLLNAKKISKKDYRVNYKCKISNEYIKFDLRFVGDNYYDEEWEKDILHTRKLNENNIYISNDENYKYSLLYHALIHKKDISNDYNNKFKYLFNEKNLENELKEYLDRKKYKITYPNDLSVYFNESNSGIPMDDCRKKYHKKIEYKRKILSILRRT